MAARAPRRPSAKLQSSPLLGRAQTVATATSVSIASPRRTARLASTVGPATMSTPATLALLGLNAPAPAARLPRAVLAKNKAQTAPTAKCALATAPTRRWTTTTPVRLACTPTQANARTALLAPIAPQALPWPSLLAASRPSATLAPTCARLKLCVGPTAEITIPARLGKSSTSGRTRATTALTSTCTVLTGSRRLGCPTWRWATTLPSALPRTRTRGGQARPSRWSRRWTTSSRRCCTNPVSLPLTDPAY